MVTYVALFNFTEKGLNAVKDTTKRATAVREAAKKAGVTIRELVWTMGKYDVVGVLEAKDEETIAAFILSIGVQGNVRSHSLRAYTASEMDAILAKLP